MASGSGGGSLFDWLNVGLQAYGVAEAHNAAADEYNIQDSMHNKINTELTKFPGMIQDVNQMYGKRLDILGQQRGASIYELLQKYNASTAKSGFAGSGALDTQRQFETSSVFDLFAGKGFELLSQQQSQLSELEAQARGLRVQAAGLPSGASTYLGNKYGDKTYAQLLEMGAPEATDWRFGMKYGRGKMGPS